MYSQPSDPETASLYNTLVQEGRSGNETDVDTVIGRHDRVTGLGNASLRSLSLYAALVCAMCAVRKVVVSLAGRYFSLLSSNHHFHSGPHPC